MEDNLVPQKPKKFVLPKCYMRNPKASDMEDIPDTLDFEEPLVIVETLTKIPETIATPEAIVVPESAVTKKKKKEGTKAKKPVIAQAEETKKRKPTAYNIFVKETLANLASSHPQLTSQERFALAIKLWNDSKAVTAVTA